MMRITRSQPGSNNDINNNHDGRGNCAEFDSENGSKDCVLQND